MEEKKKKKSAESSRKSAMMSAFVILIVAVVGLAWFILLNDNENDENYKIIKQRIPFELANVIVEEDEQTNKYGLIDLSGKLIVPYEYDFIDDFYAGTAIARKDGRNNIIDETGKIVFSDIGNVSKSGEFYIVSKNFSENKEKTELLEQENIKYAVLDSMGQMILDYEYNNIYVEGSVFVGEIRDETGVKTWPINLEGKKILEQSYNSIDVANSGEYAVLTAKLGSNEEQYLFYAKTGKTFKLDKEYTDCELVGNYLIATKDKKKVLLDLEGKYLMELGEYKIYQGVLTVQVGKSVEIYNGYKKVKTLDGYRLEEMYLDMVVTVNNKNGEYEVYDRDGKLCISNKERVYQILTPNVFVTRADIDFQIIGKDGKKITNETVYFYNGIVGKEGKIEYILIYTDLERTECMVIDEQGDEVLKGAYSQVWFNVEGEKYLRVQEEDKWGLYDLNEKKLVLDAIYDSIEFSTKAKYITVDDSIYNYDMIKIK